MTTPFIVGLGGTLREKSYTRASLREGMRLVEQHGGCAELLDLRALNLPMFVPGYRINDYPLAQRASIARLLDTSRRADAMLWSSATYHGTITGVLKNALDFLDLLADDTPPYLQGRAVGLLALSASETFGAMSNAAHELRAWVAPTHVTLSKSEDFTAHMTLTDGRARRRMTRLVGELIEFATQRTLARAARVASNHS